MKEQKIKESKKKKKDGQLFVFFFFFFFSAFSFLYLKWILLYSSCFFFSLKKIYVRKRSRRRTKATDEKRKREKEKCKEIQGDKNVRMYLCWVYGEVYIWRRRRRKNYLRKHRLRIKKIHKNLRMKREKTKK